jgi:hypothetical protein
MFSKIGALDYELEVKKPFDARSYADISAFEPGYQESRGARICTFCGVIKLT